MKFHDNLVSVLIPTYNRCELVQQSIESVLKQTFQSYEIIIVDDGSTDGTVHTLQDRYGDRIKLVCQENQGESAARNHGAAMASGKYLGFLDSDDVWEPEKLEWQVNALEGNPKAVLAFSSYWFIDYHGQRIVTHPNGMIVDTGEVTVPNLLLLNIRIGGSNPLITKTSFEMAGGYDPSIQYGEDVDFILRLRLLGDFAYVDRPLLNIRHHEGNQGALVKPEDIGRYLKEHLQVVERVVSSLNPHRDAQALKRRAYAFYYQRTAFQCFSWWLWKQGFEYLSEAAKYDPDYLNEREWIKNGLIRYGKLGRNIEAPLNVEHFLCYVDQIKKHWPQDLPINEEALTAVQSSLVLYACQELFRRKDRSGVRQACQTAIRLDKRNLLNPGIVRRLMWSLKP